MAISSNPESVNSRASRATCNDGDEDLNAARLVTNCGGCKDYNKRIDAQQHSCTSFEVTADSRLQYWFSFLINHFFFAALCESFATFAVKKAEPQSSLSKTQRYAKEMRVVVPINVR
jgi:hypothetical protein